MTNGSFHSVWFAVGPVSVGLVPVNGDRPNQALAE
jgi:hypothetical protein